MNNMLIGKALKFVGFITIFINIGSLILSIMVSPFAFITGTQLLFYFLDSMPYILLGMSIVWLGQRINKNALSPDKNDRTIRNKPIGKGTKIFGWVVVILASIYTFFGYVAVSSDASGRAYAPLILTVGIIFVAVGLVIVWFGMRIQKNAESN